MEQYIPKSAVVAEIEKRIKEHHSGYLVCLKDILSFLDTLEVKEVDFVKLGEIARHLIAVKYHIEDIRLDKEEWFVLEKIGYPERFKAMKEE